MTKKKILGIFDRRITIWIHYIILVISSYLIFKITEIYSDINSWGILRMFIFWFIVISILDQIIHKILGVD